METPFIALLVSNLPGIVTGIITGIIILVIEYRTGWFIKNKREKLSNVNSNYPNSIPRIYRVSNRNWLDRDWIGISLQIAFFLLIFFMVFLIIGTPISFALSGSTSTVLDNSKNPNIAVKNIGEGDSKAFFNDALFITLNGVAGDAEVSFTVGQIGAPSQFVERARNGTAILYSANGITYDIRVTSISYLSMFGGDSADFTVTKMP